MCCPHTLPTYRPLHQSLEPSAEGYLREHKEQQAAGGVGVTLGSPLNHLPTEPSLQIGHLIYPEGSSTDPPVPAPCPSPAASGPQAELSALTFKVQGLHHVDLTPVGAVGDVIQVPGGGEQGAEASSGDQLHLLRIADWCLFSPHLNDRIWPNLAQN